MSKISRRTLVGLVCLAIIVGLAQAGEHIIVDISQECPNVNGVGCDLLYNPVDPPEFEGLLYLPSETFKMDLKPSDVKCVFENVCSSDVAVAPTSTMDDRIQGVCSSRCKSVCNNTDASCINACLDSCSRCANAVDPSTQSHAKRYLCHEANLAASDSKNHVVMKIEVGILFTVFDTVPQSVSAKVVNVRANDLAGVRGKRLDHVSADAGHPHGGFNTPTGLAYDESSGLLYVADTGNKKIKAINLNCPAASTICRRVIPIAGQHGTRFYDGTEFNDPLGLAIGHMKGRSYLFITDPSKDTIDKTSIRRSHRAARLLGPSVHLLASQANGLDPAIAIAVSEYQDAEITYLLTEPLSGGYKLEFIDLSNPSGVDLLRDISNIVVRPTGLGMDDKGFLYIADNPSNDASPSTPSRVYRIDPCWRNMQLFVGSAGDIGPNGQGPYILVPDYLTDIGSIAIFSGSIDNHSNKQGKAAGGRKNASTTNTTNTPLNRTPVNDRPRCAIDPFLVNLDSIAAIAGKSGFFMAVDPDGDPCWTCDPPQ